MSAEHGECRDSKILDAHFETRVRADYNKSGTIETPLEWDLSEASWACPAVTEHSQTELSSMNDR